MKILTIVLLLAGIGLIGAGLWLYTPDKPREQLERAYATSPADFIRVAGLRLHIRDTGPRDAPAIILLHGLGSSLHTWEPWARTLSAMYRVIRFDLPGLRADGRGSDGRLLGCEKRRRYLLALMDSARRSIERRSPATRWAVRSRGCSPPPIPIGSTG